MISFGCALMSGGKKAFLKNFFELNDGARSLKNYYYFFYTKQDIKGQESYRLIALKNRHAKIFNILGSMYVIKKMLYDGQVGFSLGLPSGFNI